MFSVVYDTAYVAIQVLARYVDHGSFRCCGIIRNVFVNRKTFYKFWADCIPALSKTMICLRPALLHFPKYVIHFLQE